MSNRGGTPFFTQDGADSRCCSCWCTDQKTVYNMKNVESTALCLILCLPPCAHHSGSTPLCASLITSAGVVRRRKTTTRQPCLAVTGQGRHALFLLLLLVINTTTTNSLNKLEQSTSGSSLSPPFLSVLMPTCTAQSAAREDTVCSVSAWLPGAHVITSVGHR